MSAAASVVQASMVIILTNERDWVIVSKALFNFALSHGVLILASVVHHIPTAQPHRCLLIFMRVVLTGLMVISWMEVHRFTTWDVK